LVEPVNFEFQSFQFRFVSSIDELFGKEMVKIAGLIAHFERASRSNARSPAQTTPLALIRKDSFFRRQSTFSPKKDRIYRQNGSALLFASANNGDLFSAGSDAESDDNSESAALFEPLSPQSLTADSPASRTADSTRPPNGPKFKILSASVRHPDDNNNGDDDDDQDEDNDDDVDDDDHSDSADSLRELIATEHTYAARLGVLVDDVLLVVRERHLMTDAQCRVVFGNIEQVRECAARFLAAVAAPSSAARPAMRNPKAAVARSLTTTHAMIAAVRPPTIDALCAAFAAAGMQEPLARYVQGYSDAVTTLEALAHDSPELRQLVERHGAIDLLVEPVQRVSRHALLLRAVLAAAPEPNEALAALLASVETTARRVDESLRSAEARRRVQQIERSFGQGGTTLPARATRILLKEGTVRASEQQSFTLYLFDDALVVAVRAANRPLALKRIFMLESTVARNHAHKDQCTVSVVDRHGSLQLRCVSAAQRREWAVAIESAAAATGANRTALVASLQFDEASGWKIAAAPGDDADDDDAHCTANSTLRRGDLRVDFVLDKHNRAMPAVIGLHNFGSGGGGGSPMAAAPSPSQLRRGVLRRVTRRRRLLVADTTGIAAGTIRRALAGNQLQSTIGVGARPGLQRKLSPIIPHASAVKSVAATPTRPTAKRTPLSPVVMPSKANRADVVHGTPPKATPRRKSAAKAATLPYSFKGDTGDGKENAIDTFLAELDRLQAATASTAPLAAARAIAAASSTTSGVSTPPRKSKAYREQRSELVGMLRELVSEHDELMPADAAAMPQTPRTRAKQMQKLQKDWVKLERFG
jgi:hypothetical protein